MDEHTLLVSLFVRSPLDWSTRFPPWLTFTVNTVCYIYNAGLCSVRLRDTEGQGRFEPQSSCGHRVRVQISLLVRVIKLCSFAFGV